MLSTPALQGAAGFQVMVPEGPCPSPLLWLPSSVVCLQTISCRGHWSLTFLPLGPSQTTREYGRGREGEEKRGCGQWPQDKCWQAHRMSEVGAFGAHPIWSWTKAQRGCGSWPPSCRALAVEPVLHFWTSHFSTASTQHFLLKIHFLNFLFEIILDLTDELQK